ncbi:MAG: naringenin-chalcone synthase [Bdellovibrionota bacterium]
METNLVHLHSFLPVFPSCHLNQNQILDWTMKAHQKSLELLGAHDPEKLQSLRRFFLDDEQIHSRWYEIDDIDEDWNQHSIYSITAETPHGKDISARNNFFDERAKKIFAEIYEKNSVPDHLIHVTCTGYISPSPGQKFFAGKDLRPEITHAYHMGCYASIPAVRMGEALVKGRALEVDIIHTEMCSLHMDPELVSPEQMVVQSLFADGHIKYRLSPEPSGKSLKILSTLEVLVPDSSDDMTWVPGPYGMKMTLSREVPMKIAGELTPFLTRLSLSAGYELPSLLKKAIFAIHPGGPKIVSGIQMLLGLSDEQVKSSRKVLYERGNMSSATLPHVWADILDGNPEKGTPVVAMAFGPGLTIIGCIFEVA